MKYFVNNYSIDAVLSWYKIKDRYGNRDMAIPEIQRPFVWKSVKVRKLIDSLYQGYPIGYLTIWQNPDVRLKDGGFSEGKKIIIDGQQRIISLITSILGEEIVTKNYKKVRITIAFNPQTEEFEVLNPAIEKSSEWIKDVGPIISGEEGIIGVFNEYCNLNPNVNRGKIESILQRLQSIRNRQVGIIELNHNLDIETVTEIFVRINSEGVILNQADFAMSKIASNERYNGPILRKCIDYFCHAVEEPEFLNSIRQANENFANTDFFQRIWWVRNNNQDIYKPNYSDLLRVAFTSRFNRGKLSDLVDLLSGRNFETREYEEEIMEGSFEKLKIGILDFVNQTNFERFIMIIKSAGFISPEMIRSKNNLNFAYILYLKLRQQGYDQDKIEKYIKRWFVMSILTKRYSGSPESQFDFDIKKISSLNFDDFLNEVESAKLSDAYWNNELIQNLTTSVASSPFFNVFLAAQVKSNDKGFLSKDILIRDLILQRGDIHHLFPREYLKSNGLGRKEYNQIANYVYTQSEINIKIGRRPPMEYMTKVFEQYSNGELRYGGMSNINILLENLKENCIPEEIKDMDFNRYNEFLEKRKILIARRIKDYYKSL